jgi:predicted small lipoprotein YifL
MMRSPVRRFLLPLLLFLALLNGCGFKGPLYLPEEKSKPAPPVVKDTPSRQE